MIGHQEVDRIADEIEQIYSSQPTEWLALEPIGMMLLHGAGHDDAIYEDFDEFEDALGGSFEEFVKALPQFEVRTNETSGKVEYKVLPLDPDAPPTVMTLQVTQRSDLWRVLFKSPDASVRIPHLEFEIGADSKRRIDTVYNHITNAVWNLSAHVRSSTDAARAAAAAAAEAAEASETEQDASATQAASILETVDALEALLDVEEPFEIVVVDPTGASRFKPSDGVEVEEL